MDDDKQERVIKFVPDTFTVDDNSINFSKRYASQFTENDLPSIVFKYLETGSENYIYLNKVFSIKTRTFENTEQFVFDDSKLVYQIEDERADSILEVEYYDSTNEEWKRVEEASYFLNDDEELEFQTNDVYPDGADGRVTYEYLKIEVSLGGEFSDMLQVDVITSDYKDEENGIYINGLRLCKLAVRRLMEEFRFGFSEPDIVVRNVTESSDLSDIEGEDYHYRHTFDVEFAYHKTYVKTFNTIEEVRGEFVDYVQDEQFDIDFDIDFEEKEKVLDFEVEAE